MKHNRHRLLFYFMLQLVAIAPYSAAAESADAYQADVLPFVETYCIECHTGEKAKGGLDLARTENTSDVAASFRRWSNVIEFIRSGEMPPEDAKQPAIDESNAVVSAVESILLAEAIKNAGDPGMVLPRRLSNTEYDLSVRDLTGVDIRPTKDFPVDPAGGEGFDNTGEALGISPNLVKKYLSAAQLVADHLVLKTDGISFAPYPVTSYNERRKFTEQAIIDFYESQAVDTLPYLESAWRYRYRDGDQQDVTIRQWAELHGLSAKYLAIVWQTLSTSSSHSGALLQLRQARDVIPAPLDALNRPTELLAVRDLVEFFRRVLSAPESQLIRPNAGNWPISHLDFRAKIAAARDQFDAANFKSETLLRTPRFSAPAADEESRHPFSLFIRIDKAFPGGDDYVVVKRPLCSKADRLPKDDADEKSHEVQSLRSLLEESNPDLVATLGFGRHPLGGEIDSEWFVARVPAIIEIPITVDMQQKLAGKHLLAPCKLDPEHSKDGSVVVQLSIRQPPGSKFTKDAELLIYSDGQTAQQLAESAAEFCNTFPNRFFYVDDGRGLAAGFHLVEGFFRDDRPLVEKILNDEEIARLDQLWRELDFVTQSAETLLRGFVWFERSEREVLHDKRFDFLRSEDPELVEDSLLNKFEKLYLDKMGIKRVGGTLEAEASDPKFEMIHGFFQQIRHGLALQSELMKLAEQRALTGLEDLTRRAYRRALRPQERESLQSLYIKLREDGQSVESSIRNVVTAVLMSPEFSYRYYTAPEGEGVFPITDYDLASRLSYFLWSSLPDEDLLSAAESGKLQDEAELLAQTRRMLKDPKIEAFAREFFGQWLRYRDYLSKDPINASAFPGYNDELREAIFQEPTRLASHLIQTDQPITALLNGDMTFVNRALAKHYGGEIERQYQGQTALSAGTRKLHRLPVANDLDQNWHAVTGLRAAGRGGLLGMAVVLTKNSAGERTSPVKRGFWSVHHLLGQHFPPPPADVPELAASESGADRTIRELLAAHVADAQCAMCHKHFDSLGLTMEGFDAIGRSRSKDRAGRLIDNVVKLPNGDSATGIPGLIDYIEGHRHRDFVRTMCRKFLGYALGRSVELSDQPLLDEIEHTLEVNDYRFSVMFEAVIRSPQFRKQRGRGFVAAGR